MTAKPSQNWVYNRELNINKMATITLKKAPFRSSTSPLRMASSGTNGFLPKVEVGPPIVALLRVLKILQSLSA